MPAFCHLHVLSQYSLRRSLVRLPALMERLQELNQTAVALTDRNGLYGAVPLVQLAEQHGIRPVIGCDLDVLSDTGDSPAVHPLTLLARNRQGYRNLCQLITHAQLATPIAVPRETLLGHSDGLILLTGGAGAEIPALVASRREHEAIRLLKLYRRAFPGRCYLELMACHRSPYLLGRLRELSAALDIPPVATQDVRYLRPGEAIVWRTLQYAYGHGHPADCPRHLADEGEMRRMWGDIPGALSNSGRIAGQCRVDLELGTLHLPQFTLLRGGKADDER